MFLLHIAESEMVSNYFPIIPEKHHSTYVYYKVEGLTNFKHFFVAFPTHVCTQTQQMYTLLPNLQVKYSVKFQYVLYDLNPGRSKIPKL